MLKNKPALLLFIKTALFIIITTSACTSTKDHGSVDSKHFTIIEASFENWQAGRPQGGTGTDYRFTAIINSSNAIQFEEVWIRDKEMAFPLTAGRLKGPATNQAFTFSKGDTIALYASTSETNSEKQPTFTDLSGEAIISYSIEGKQAYKSIPALNQKHTDPRPQ